MSDKNTDGQERVVNSSPKRRNVLQSVGVGFTTAIGLSGVGSASASKKEEASSTTVETVDVDVDSALQKLDSVIDSPLFEGLVSEGHLAEQSIEEFPAHRLADDSASGGVTRLRINGELEQLNFHKVVDGEQLEVNLPLSDNEPRAVLHRKDANSIVYHYGTGFQGKVIDDKSVKSSVGTSADCSGFKYCESCVACCGYDNWSRDLEKVDCPNCWATDCQWVKVNCC